VDGGIKLNLFDIRKIDSDKEKIKNCISCDESSTSMEIESMYEVRLFYPSHTICLCDVCLEKLKRTLNQNL
jgi:hypothetical protein